MIVLVVNNLATLPVKAVRVAILRLFWFQTLLYKVHLNCVDMRTPQSLRGSKCTRRAAAVNGVILSDMSLLVDVGNMVVVLRRMSLRVPCSSLQKLISMRPCWSRRLIRRVPTMLFSRQRMRLPVRVKESLDLFSCLSLIFHL